MTGFASNVQGCDRSKQMLLLSTGLLINSFPNNKSIELKYNTTIK